MLHPHYLDAGSGPIGRVVTSEEAPATAHEFYFWAAESDAARTLDIGHIVAAESEDATAVAVLDDPRRYSDLQSFLDDFYAYDGDPSLEALSERAEILVFRARVLATKTSHALFTISSTFQTMKDKKVAALMFNVKGADLLFLDKPVEAPEDDPELAERYERAGQRGLPPEDREMYESLGLEVKPFENLRIFAPSRYFDSADRIIHAEDVPARKLNTLRNARGEDSCVYPIIWELGDVLPYAGYVFEPSDMDDKFRGFIEELRAQNRRTMADFHVLMD